MRPITRTQWAATAAAVLAASVAAAVEFRADEELVLDGAADDVMFAAARRVRVETASTDDIYIAGATVTIAGARADRLTIAGETIIFSDFAAGDVVTAGRQVEFLGGIAADDILAAGASVTLGGDVDVRGSAVLSGAEVVVEAPIGGELRAAGERVRLNGVVAGDVELAGRRVIVGAEAQIGGGLTHRAEQIEIDPAAQIAGEIIALEPRASDVAERWAGQAVATAVVFGLIFVVGVTALMTLIAGLLPALMRQSAKMMRTQPLATVGSGFLVAFAAPVVIGLLAASILGLPIALVLLAVLATAAPVAIAASAYFAGRRASALLHKGAELAEPRFGARLGWTALAMIALIIVGLIPILGGFAWLAAYVFGLGAVVVQAARALAIGAPATA